MAFTRSAGVLLHPTSFPSRYGIGDLGEAAYRFVDFLKARAKPCGKSCRSARPAMATRPTNASQPSPATPC